MEQRSPEGYGCRVASLLVLQADGFAYFPMAKASKGATLCFIPASDSATHHAAVFQLLKVGGDRLVAGDPSDFGDVEQKLARFFKRDAHITRYSMSPTSSDSAFRRRMTFIG